MRTNNIRNLLLIILSCLIFDSTCSVFAAEKPRVGVLRFTNNTHAYWWSAGVSFDLQDMLINELVACKSFHVLDRHELYSLLEQKFMESVFTDPKAKQKSGKIKGVKYLVAATVSAFEEKTNGSGNTMFLTGLSSPDDQNKAYVVIDLKIIDGETGAIVDSHSIEATSSGSSLQNGHAGNTAKFWGSMVRREKTPVGKAIRNSIIETTEYLECSLITRNEECTKRYGAMEAKIKEKSKAAIHLDE